MNVTLRPIDKTNFETVGYLSVAKYQKDLLADNMLSIAECQFFPTYVPRAIYLNGKPVGFALYEPLTEKGRPNEYLIFRFMVDKEYQKKGIGTRAMRLLIEEIQRIPGAEKITICYADENENARTFYKNLGFVETGPDPEDEDEIMAEYNIGS